MADSALVGFFAPGIGRTSGSDSPSKRKGRPRAAEVETTAEDIKNLKEFQGTPRLELAEAIHFRFLFAYKNCALCLKDCQEAAPRETALDYLSSGIPRRPLTELTRMRKNNGLISSSRMTMRRSAMAFNHQ